MSEHTYSAKTRADGANASPAEGDPNWMELVQTVLPGKDFQIAGDGPYLVVFDDILTPSEITALDQSHTDWDPAELEVLRKVRYAEFDKKTVDLVLEGFTWGGVLLPLDALSQERYTQAWNCRNEPAFTYPADFSGVINDTKVTCADADDVDDMYTQCVIKVRERNDSGESLKQQVRDATTVAAINAVVDNR